MDSPPGTAAEGSYSGWDGRWYHISKLLERPGPLACPNFEPGPENLDAFKICKILVVGAGGLGCELLKNLVSLLEYDEDGNPDIASVIPIIDGGTEGFKGNARVVLPGFTPCIECTVNLFPPQVNFPMCTIAHTPRLPEHCIEYVRMILWEKEKPFNGAAIDGDDPKHVQWILERASARADEHGIKGVTYRLTQGVIKHIIPAVASTNAVVAAYLSNYINFQDSVGVFVGCVQMEKRGDCLVCSQKPQKVSFPEDAKLQDVIDFLVESPEYQMKSPAITVASPSFVTLYMGNIPSMEQKTRPNLKKTLKELQLTDGQEIYIADQTSPATRTFKLELTFPMEH